MTTDITIHRVNPEAAERLREAFSAICVAVNQLGRAFFEFARTIANDPALRELLTQLVRHQERMGRLRVQHKRKGRPGWKRCR